MIRKLKALGLALVAVFALGAMAATSASADTFEAASEPIYLTGTDVGADQFEVYAFQWFCEEVKYSGKMTAGPTTSVVLNPTYNKCKTESIYSMFFDMNTCFYRFTINDSIANDTTGTMHIECVKVGDEVAVTAELGMGEKGKGTTKCTVNIEEQTIPVTYSAVGGGTQVRAAINYNGLKYSVPKGTGIYYCGSSPSVTVSSGAYRGELSLSGFSDAAHTKASALWLVK